MICMKMADAISFMKSSEFPRKLSFQRSPNSVLDMSAEMPEGSFTVIVRQHVDFCCYCLCYVTHILHDDFTLLAFKGSNSVTV